ncbi:MAG: hypothetical protein JSR96_15135 [Proteobacteria bacterium]|nr:hypothetical protein [Pseudomonadota bacterium]
MEWNDLPISSLDRALRSKSLAHPTSAAFDADAWITAAETLAQPTERDADLAVAAIHYGCELADLRKFSIPLITKGLSRPRLVQLLAAYANHQYLVLLRKASRQARRDRREGGILDMERAQQQFVANAGGQELPADDHLTFLVDSMPHWLFHIWQVGDEGDDEGPEDPWAFGATASAIVSVEHSLKQLWMGALWLGDAILKEGAALIESPRDRTLAQRWFIWDLRQTMLYSMEHGLEVGARIVAGRKLPPVVPVNARTVIRIERTPGGHRRFIVGNASGARDEQRGHASERDMLEGTYVSLFLDETLPRSPRGAFTCRQLNSAWWILQDIARLVADELGKHGPAGPDSLRRFSFAVERRDLSRALRECLGLDAPSADDIVDWFTCDPSDTGRLFAKSLWAEPLLPVPHCERRHVMIAPLLVGAPVKRVEAWMDKGGISDSRGVKGRGKPFERHVRLDVERALLANELIADASVGKHGLKRRGNSEEIDLIARIGDTVIVGEVKCFVAPSEPLERHNHLDNLARAAEQAANKRAWAEGNREAVGAALGVTDPQRAAALTIIPVVIINNGFGLGLERHGVPIVDLHFLVTLLSGGRYRSGMRFERHVGIISEHVTMYTSQAELEERIGDILRDPPPLHRFDSALRWRRMPFPTSQQKEFFIELPALAEQPPPNALRDLPALAPFARSG